MPYKIVVYFLNLEGISTHTDNYEYRYFMNCKIYTRIISIQFNNVTCHFENHLQSLVFRV